ncbi:MAG: hypothetical protein KAJ19_26585, partial [Gammaproteobacteria bacterium]|nr:hypothetical protein [Gammaproteobacteria bacterium]
MKKLILFFMLFAALPLYGAYIREDTGWETTDWNGFKLWIESVAPSDIDWPHDFSSVEKLYETSVNPTFDSSAYASNNFPGNTGTVNSTTYIPATNGETASYSFNGIGNVNTMPSTPALRLTNGWTIDVWTKNWDSFINSEPIYRKDGSYALHSFSGLFNFTGWKDGGGFLGAMTVA